MIETLLAFCLTGLQDRNLEEDSTQSLQIRAREFDLQGHQYAGVTHGFILLREGSVRESSRMHVLDAEGNTVTTLDDYHLLGSSGPHVKLFRRDFYGFKSIMPDGSIRRAVGVPIEGGGEFVAFTFRRELTHPETAERFLETSGGTWNMTRSTDFQLAGSGWDSSRDRPVLAIRNGEELEILPQLERYFIGEGIGFQVLFADTSKIIANQLLNEHLLTTSRYTYIWSGGEIETLPKPAEFVTNIDGQQSRVTNWWGEIYTPEGRIVGITACQDADAGTQSKFFIAIWEGERAQVLPLPDDLVELVRAGPPPFDPPPGLNDYYVGLMREVIGLYRLNLSADIYGNIGLSVRWGIANQDSFIWDGRKWHNVTKGLDIGPGPFTLTLLPEGRVAILNRTPATDGHRPTNHVWRLDY